MLKKNKRVGSNPKIKKAHNFCFNSNDYFLNLKSKVILQKINFVPHNRKHLSVLSRKFPSINLTLFSSLTKNHVYYYHTFISLNISPSGTLTKSKKYRNGHYVH